MLQFIKKNYGKIGMSFSLIMLVICWFQQKELNELRTKVSLIPPTVDTAYLGGGDIMKAELIDSLQTELFNEKTNVGRYELTLEHLKEVNPKLGKEMEDWMSHNTE